MTARTLTNALLGALLGVGIVIEVAAQTTDTAASQSRPAGAGESSSAERPAMPAASDAKPSETVSPTSPAASTGAQPAYRSDDPAALPRTATRGTTVFGLSPTAAVVLAAALFVVVILALVSMTRRATSEIDRRG